MSLRRSREIMGGRGRACRTEVRGPAPEAPPGTCSSRPPGADGRQAVSRRRAGGSLAAIRVVEPPPEACRPLAGRQSSATPRMPLGSMAQTRRGGGCAMRRRGNRSRRRARPPPAMGVLGTARELSADAPSAAPLAAQRGHTAHSPAEHGSIMEGGGEHGRLSPRP